MKRGARALLILAVAACGNNGVAPPKNTSVDRQAPDQVMTGMRTYILRQGVKRADAEADTAFINQQTHLADLVGLRVTFFDTTTGRVMSVITSKTGKLDLETQGFDARGNVVAVTTEGKTLKTEHLVYDKVQDRIHSDTAFTITGSTEDMSGSSFESDAGFKSVLITHPVGREKKVPAKRAGTKSGGSE